MKKRPKKAEVVEVKVETNERWRKSYDLEQFFAALRPDEPWTLDDKELRVLRCLSEGLTNREMADRLSLPEDAVKTYVMELGKKIGKHERGVRAIKVFRDAKFGVGKSHTLMRVDQEPPQSARFILLCLCPRSTRETLLGDLEEEYRTLIIPKVGARKARMWYWYQVASSVVPLLWSKLIRLAAFVMWFKRVQ